MPTAHWETCPEDPDIEVECVSERRGSGTHRRYRLFVAGKKLAEETRTDEHDSVVLRGRFSDREKLRAIRARIHTFGVNDALFGASGDTSDTRFTALRDALRRQRDHPFVFDVESNRRLEEIEGAIDSKFYRLIDQIRIKIGKMVFVDCIPIERSGTLWTKLIQMTEFVQHKQKISNGAPSGTAGAVEELCAKCESTVVAIRDQIAHFDWRGMSCSLEIDRTELSDLEAYGTFE